MASPPESPPPARRLPPALIGVGVLVVAVGFGLPRLVPDPTPSEPSASRPDAPIPAAAPAPPAAPSAAPELIAALARTAGCLVVVCGLCVAAVRLVGRRPPARAVGMEVIASLPIDARCAVHLVKAGDRRLLVGTDLGGVKSLVELPGLPPDVPAVAVPAAAAEPVVVGPVAVTVPDADEIAALVARFQRATGSASRERERPE